MRPKEQDVTFRLAQMVCGASEDSGGDNPYFWILGFKVDADTMTGPPPAGSLVPLLDVQVFTGVPASPFPVGNTDVHSSRTPIQIPAALGTRSLRLKPSLLPTGKWFAGLAGVVCVLLERDNTSPSTSEAGFNRFKKVFGPSLSTELTKMMNGAYDAELSRDGANNVISAPTGGLDWRLARLVDSAARKNAVKAITKAVRDEIAQDVKGAMTDAGTWDEAWDPDDILGVEAQVFLGDELRSIQTLEMRFTDDDADYTVTGYAVGAPVHVVRMDSTVANIDRRLDQQVLVPARICWFPPDVYSAFAFRAKTTLRYELRTLVGPLPVSVRWFVDGQVLADGQGSVTVKFDSLANRAGAAYQALGASYPGGDSALDYTTAGSVLEIGNEAGDGVFFGKVTALYSFAGDPTLFPPGPQDRDALAPLGYEQQADIGILAVEAHMDAKYKAAVAQCEGIKDEIDRKHVFVDYGRAPINPGDPPPDLGMFKPVIAGIPLQIRTGVRRAE